VDCGLEAGLWLRMGPVGDDKSVRVLPGPVVVAWRIGSCQKSVIIG